MLSRRNALKTAVAWLLAPTLAGPAARAMKMVRPVPCEVIQVPSMKMVRPVPCEVIQVSFSSIPSANIIYGPRYLIKFPRPTAAEFIASDSVASLEHSDKPAV